jgi:hypothetical protein
VDFVATTARITEFLEARGHHAALIGGLALAAYGLPRTTLDADFVTELAAQQPLIEWLENDGFETLHRSRGYSNHLHADRERGRVDFVYVDPATAEKVFGAARSMPGPGGLPVLVAAPEHLAAMKVLALRNDPSREAQDLADLRFLLALPGIDRAEVRESFVRHGLLDRYEALVASL